jgi:hypothetical protein
MKLEEVMDKCESLVRSRWIPETKDAKGNIVRGCWRKLADPEHCGEPGTKYSVRKKPKQAKRPKSKPHWFLIPSLSVPAGTMFVTTCLCDKHKNKAEREGNEVLAVGGREEVLNYGTD